MFAVVPEAPLEQTRERRFSEKVRGRFDLPVTEMLLDRDGRVLSVCRVTADERATGELLVGR
jgi:hypothetical protein